MTTKFIKDGTTFRVTNDINLNLVDRLPPGNFLIKINALTNELYFDAIEPFEVPSRIYGAQHGYAERIMTTFLDRPNKATGVLLNGEKGSGKTMLAKMISIDGYARGMPTIVINSPFQGDRFNELLQRITQPAIILFDEFEKVYVNDNGHPDQDGMLTLLDGVFPSQKLFVLTCNDKFRVNSYMRNRPGRIFYTIDFTGLDSAFIAEYCEENLKDKSQTEAVCRLATVFFEFNFDMLKALVEEMNRYDEPPQRAIKLLNAKPEYDSGQKFDIELSWRGRKLNTADYEPTGWAGNPLMTEQIEMSYRSTERGQPVTAEMSASIRNDDNDDIEHAWENFTFRTAQLAKLDGSSGMMTYEVEGFTIRFVKQVAYKFNYDTF